MMKSLINLDTVVNKHLNEFLLQEMIASVQESICDRMQLIIRIENDNVNVDAENYVFK